VCRRLQTAGKKEKKMGSKEKMQLVVWRTEGSCQEAVD